jgi:hypothetical protein
MFKKYINRNHDTGLFNTDIIKINGKSYIIKLKKVKNLDINDIMKYEIVKEIYYKKYDTIVKITFTEYMNCISISIHNKITNKTLVFQFQGTCSLIIDGIDIYPETSIHLNYYEYALLKIFLRCIYRGYSCEKSRKIISSLI